MKPGVIVLCGVSSKMFSPTALGVIKCLNQENIPTLLITPDINDPARYSSNINHFLIDDPKDFSNRYLQKLLWIGKKFRDYVLMPTSDETVKLVSDHRDILGKYFKVPMPKKEVIDICLNKSKTYEIAKKNNIPFPLTLKCNNVHELEIASNRISYPGLLKPSTPIERNFYSKKVLEFDSPRQLISFGKYFIKLGCSPLVQEKIVGPPSNLYSLGTVISSDNNQIAIFTGRKIRQISYEFGVGTFCESIWVPEVAELGEKLLNSINYYGIAQVEFKFDVRDQEYKLMEINARPWFWISLTASCGMNIPYIAYKYAIGEEISVDSFLENVHWQWLAGDLGLLVTQLIAKNPSFSFKDYFQSYLKKRVYATYSKNDIRPFIKELSQSIINLGDNLRYLN